MVLEESSSGPPDGPLRRPTVQGLSVVVLGLLTGPYRRLPLYSVRLPPMELGRLHDGPCGPGVHSV